MARGVNKVILIGTMGKDPEVRKMPQNNESVCTISIATNEKWKDKNTGKDVERTEWHRVSMFGQKADFVGQYAKKGSMIYVEGSLQTKKWQDKEGKDVYQTEVKCSEVQILSGGASSAGSVTNHSSDPSFEPTGGF